MSAPVLTPDFSHRIKHGSNDDPLTTIDLIHGIENIVNRADGVIGIAQGCFYGADSDEINPTTMYFALESVQKDLKDLMAICSILAGQALKKNTSDTKKPA